MKRNKILYVIMFGLILGLCSNVFCEEASPIISDIPYTSKPWIGIKVNNYIKESVKKETNEGVKIKNIVDLKLEGIEKGDIINKIDDTDVFTVDDFKNILSKKEIGKEIKLQIVRDNEKIQITLKLKDTLKQAEEVLKNLGLKVKTVKKDNTFAIVVADIIKNSKAETFGINKDDILLGINRTSFNNIEEFNDVTSHIDLGKETYLLVMRKDGENYITVTKQIGEAKETSKEEIENEESFH